MLETFSKVLSTHSSKDHEENAVNSFLETVQRLIRNLINDDQNDPAVRDSWAALRQFLTPKWFPVDTLMRQSVSIALGDAIKQCRTVGLNELIPGLVRQIELEDLRSASSSALWRESALAMVHYFDSREDVGRVEKSDEDTLIDILKAFKNYSKTKWPALMLPAFEGCLATAKFIRQLFGEDINSSQSEGWTVLMAAAHRGHAHIVDWLISEGADPNLTRLDNDWTALMAASHAGHLEVVDRLIAAKASVDQGRTDNGWTALMLASQEGHLEVVDRLIAAKASVDLGTTDNGSTALMAASQEGHLDVVGHLIKAGATVDQKSTDNGATALMHARKKGHQEIVTRLIEAGATSPQANKGKS